MNLAYGLINVANGMADPKVVLREFGNDITSREFLSFVHDHFFYARAGAKLSRARANAMREYTLTEEEQQKNILEEFLARTEIVSTISDSYQ
jgi:hypothetical protein